MLRTKFFFLCMAIILSLLVSAGCSLHAPVKTPEPKVQLPEESKQVDNWWSVRFRLNWPEKKDPAWELDLLIAHRIVGPILEKYEQRIPLWRFHRRAARDQLGHRFSFIFYASTETAAAIYSDFQADKVLQETLSEGLVNTVTYDDLNRTDRLKIEDTSDPDWPPVVKKTWPYYITGASRMWLNLIDETVNETGAEQYSAKNIKEMRIFYSQVNDEITEVWQEKGRHAYLHHLNAIFGYEPLLFYEKRLLRF